MMRVFITQGPHTGEYPIASELTMREMRIIKNVSGVVLAKVPDAIGSGDTDVLIALALIATSRAGHEVTEEELLDLPVTAITIDVEASAQTTTTPEASPASPPTKPGQRRSRARVPDPEAA